MQSAFTKKRSNPQATANPATEETYGLLGLNLRDPDEEMPAGESPWTINSRFYARNDGESRVAIRTRMGASHLANPVGETLDTQNVGTALQTYSFGTLSDLSIVRLAQQFTPGTSGPLTRLDLEIENLAGASGHVFVEIHADNSGIPDPAVIGQGSILGNLVSSSITYQTARSEERRVG